MYKFKTNPKQYCLIRNGNNSCQIYDLLNKEYCRFDNPHVSQNIAYFLKLMNTTEYNTVNEIYAKKRKSTFLKNILEKVSRSIESFGELTPNLGVQADDVSI